MKVVTSIYELFKETTGHPYRDLAAGYLKPFTLLPKNDWLSYVVYTDSSTYTKYNLEGIVQSNVEVRIFELDRSPYKEGFTKIKNTYDKTDNWFHLEKQLSVPNYTELMYQKFNFVKDSITPQDDVVIWLDSGVFFNSCDYAWRPWIGENCVKEEFFLKVREYVKNDFMIIKSEEMGYAQFSNILDCIDSPVDPKNQIVSGGIWGGDAKKTSAMMDRLIDNVKLILDKGIYVSDQEVMSMEFLKRPQDFKVVPFLNWYDYQRALLTLCGRLDAQYVYNHCHL